jgi:hypothetical protein
MAVQCEDDGVKLADAIIAEEMNKANELAKYADSDNATRPRDLLSCCRRSGRLS